MKKKSAILKRSTTDRLRSLVTAQLPGGDTHYTQKELSEKLGISTSTLRRFKYQRANLSSRTLARIHARVVRLEASFRRYLKHRYAIADTRLIQIPKETKLLNGSRSLVFAMEYWSTEEKIEFFNGWVDKIKAEKLDHFRIKKIDFFASWNLKIKTTWKSAEKGEQFDEPDEEDNEIRFYQTDPASFVKITRIYIRQFFTYHDDHYENESGNFRGRMILELYIYLPNKPKRKKRKT